jgi:hypothetical protein
MLGACRLPPAVASSVLSCCTVDCTFCAAALCGASNVPLFRAWTSPSRWERPALHAGSALHWGLVFKASSIGPAESTTLAASVKNGSVGVRESADGVQQLGRRGELLLHLVQRRGELGHGPAGASDLVANVGEARGELVGATGQCVEVGGSVADACRGVGEVGADLSGLKAELGLIQRLAGRSRDAAHHGDVG